MRRKKLTKEIYMEAFSLAAAGHMERVVAALDADVGLLDRPQKGGIFDSRTLRGIVFMNNHK